MQNTVQSWSADKFTHCSPVPQAAAADGLRWKYEAERVAAELAATSSTFSDALADSEAKVVHLLVCCCSVAGGSSMCLHPVIQSLSVLALQMSIGVGLSRVE